MRECFGPVEHEQLEAAYFQSGVSPASVEISKSLAFHRLKNPDKVYLICSRLSLCLSRCKFIIQMAFLKIN